LAVPVSFQFIENRPVNFPQGPHVVGWEKSAATALVILVHTEPLAAIVVKNVLVCGFPAFVVLLSLVVASYGHVNAAKRLSQPFAASRKATLCNGV
jgi:hypothetical protein